MDHWRTLTPKLLAGGIPAFIILALVGGMSWGTALLVSLALVLAAYFIGDLLILPAAGNLVATVADAGLVFIFLWLVRSIGVDFRFNAVWWIVVLLAIIEGLIYHPFLARLASMDSMDPRLAIKRRKER